LSDVQADLTWEGGSIVACRSADVGTRLDWESGTAPSPVQALAFALAGCMVTDVVLILEKGRQPLRALSARLEAARAADPPRRLLRVDIRFAITGDIAADKVERAIALSRETYCSVWHSMAPDTALTTSFDIETKA
jgi:putative redox protein